jgi:hypothetical protein
MEDHDQQIQQISSGAAPGNGLSAHAGAPARYLPVALVCPDGGWRAAITSPPA